MTGRLTLAEDAVRGVVKPRTLDEVRSWPATVDVETACAPYGISRSFGYELARRGEFPARVITVGARKRVVTASIIATLSSADEGTPGGGGRGS